MGQVEALDRLERAAIAAGAWERIDNILEQQTKLWESLAPAVLGAGSAPPPQDAARALRRLYEVRRCNHALIERSFAKLRARVLLARAGETARAACENTMRNAA